MDENPYKSPEDCSDEPATPEQPYRRAGKKSRIVFFAQVFGLVLCIITGMSESYSWLTWVQWLIPVFVPAVLVMVMVSPAFPLAILWVGLSEKVESEALTFAVLLSVAMTVASYFAILPLVS